MAKWWLPMADQSDPSTFLPKLSRLIIPITLSMPPRDNVRPVIMWGEKGDFAPIISPYYQNSRYRFVIGQLHQGKVPLRKFTNRCFLESLLNADPKFHQNIFKNIHWPCSWVLVNLDWLVLKYQMGQAGWYLAEVRNFGQIHWLIWTNLLCHWDKYSWQFLPVFFQKENRVGWLVSPEGLPTQKCEN